VTPALPAGPPLLRESAHQARATALDKVVDALKPFNKVERTALLASVAEFYVLSLTVEN
jgi:hypothetical protein